MALRNYRMAAAGAVLSASLVVGAQAHAVTTFDGSFTVDANTSDPGLVVHTYSWNDGEFTFDLSEGGSTSVKLFDIWTDESWVNPDDTVHKDISVNFSFSEPDGFTDPGIGGHTFGGSLLWGLSQWGEVQWDNPANLPFGTDGLLQVSLTETTFNKGLFGLNSGERHGASIFADFTLVAAATPVPAPAALALMGIGLFAIGAVRRRRAG